MKYLLCILLLLCNCLFVFSRSANKDENEIVDLLKDRLSLPKTPNSNKELLEKLGLSQKSTWEKTKEFLGKSEEEYIVENLKQRMGLPQDEKSNIILKDELLGLPSFKIPQRTWLQRLGNIFGFGRRSMKERLYDALGGAAAIELLQKSTSDIAGQATKKVEDTMESLKEKAYDKLGENVAGSLKQKGHNLKETISETYCDTKECATKAAEKMQPSQGLLWGILSSMSTFVFGNHTKAKEHNICEGEYYSAKECAKERAKETVENAKETLKCTTEMAKDKLCDIKDTIVERGSEALHAAQAATHKVEDLYESAKDRVEHKAKETLKGVKDKTASAYQEVKETTKGAYEGAKEKAKDTYEEVKEKTKDVYEDAKSKGKETVEEAKSKASNVYEGAKEGAQRAYEGTKEGAQRIYEGTREAYEGAKDTAEEAKEALKEKIGERYEEAKEKLSETRDQFLGKLDLTRDESSIIDKLRNKLGLSKDMGYPDLLEKLGYGRESLPASSRVNLTPDEMRVIEKLNEYHASYRRKPALEQFKENIGYNEDEARRVRHEHLREHKVMEGKPFPEDISGFGDVIKEQKNLKKEIPV